MSKLDQTNSYRRDMRPHVLTRRSLDGASDARRSLDGASDARRLLDGASDARRLLDGASDVRRPLDGASDARRPIIDPFLLALKSRRVLIALSTILGGLIVLAMPSLTAVQGEIFVLLITMALAVIGGYSLEDAARAARSTPIPPDFADQIRELVAGLLEELQTEE